MNKYARRRRERLEASLRKRGFINRWEHFFTGVDMAGGKDMSYIVHGYWYPGKDAFHVSGYEVRP